jgi:sporulation protein YlmC with PRC-barrel domain
MTAASSLVGKQILDARGQSLAEIRDLIVDSRGGLTAVVELPGTPGFTGIPLSKLSPMVGQSAAGAAATGTQPTAAPVNDATMSIDHFVLSGNTLQLQKAPVLNDVSTVDDQWLTQVDQTFGVTSNHLASTAGQVVRRPMGLQELLRRRVASVGGDGLGNVKDLAVSLRDSRVAFLVFGGQMAGQADPVFHGVALDSFNFDDPQNVLIDTDRATLARSKGIDLARMPSQPSFALPAGPKVIRTPGNGTAPAEKPGGAGTNKPDSGGRGPK